MSFSLLYPFSFERILQQWNRRRPPKVGKRREVNMKIQLAIKNKMRIDIDNDI